jgi:Ricin-type beta-trefoil lectin domain-like
MSRNFVRALDWLSPHPGRWIAVLIAALGACALLAATAGTAHAEIAAGTYVISPLHDTSRALDGAPVTQFQYHGQANQQWRITVVDRLPFSGTPVYRLRAVHSGKCLDVPGVSIDPGVDLQQFACNNGQNQQFFIDDLIGVRSWGTITPRHSGLGLQIEDASLRDGAPLEQNFTANPAKAHQRFVLFRVG